MSSHVLELATADSTMCGQLSLGDSVEDGWACAVAAHEAGEPFTLQWESSGIDSTLTQALISEGTKAWYFHQDSYPNTGPTTPSTAPIHGWDCIDMAVLEDESLEFLSCGSREPEGNHYQVCGGTHVDQVPAPLPFDP